ncbi:hypothetical protein GGU45_004364 [Niabella hirudinis]
MLNYVRTKPWVDSLFEDTKKQQQKQVGLSDYAFKTELSVSLNNSVFYANG